MTGGRWGEALAPALRPAAALVPLAALAFLGVALGLAALYPWAADPGTVKPGIAQLYLDPALFDLRAAVTLVGWSALALLRLAGRCGSLAAALGLSFYGLTISLVAVDWILSAEPHFTSSAFPASLALHQILAALAWAAVASPPGLDEERAADLAGLILATLLGVLYMGLMSYIVAWYGDLPENDDHDRGRQLARRRDGRAGSELMQRFQGARRAFQTEIVFDRINSVDFSRRRVALTGDSAVYTADAVDAGHRGVGCGGLGLPSEAAFMGRGVGACATCTTASSIAGRKSASSAAATPPSKRRCTCPTSPARVHLVHRRDKFRAEPSPGGQADGQGQGHGRIEAARVPHAWTRCWATPAG
ncbi:hypothetical protein ACU4GR_04680 [Methylobacterium oryzae CBMB20]